MVIEDITHLPTYHPHIPDSSSKFMDDIRITRESHTLETHTLEGISDEYTRRFTIFLPDSEFSSAKFIIIHRRKVIVNKRIGMDELKTDKIREDSISRESHHLLIHDHSEDRTDTLSFSLYRIADGFLELIFSWRGDLCIARVKILF
jgi:hypothetical protein